jgi:hypothetical protein
VGISQLLKGTPRAVPDKYASYGPRSSLRGTRSPPRERVGVPPRRDRMDFANPTFEQMARH